MSREQGDVNGLAWVKDGKVFVQDPKPGGEPASILPHKDIDIFISGRRISGEEPLTSSSDVQVRLPSQDPAVTYSVEIQKGGLEAQARIEVREGSKSHLIDTPPARRLVLKYESEPVTVAPDRDRLLQVLREAGVEFGIDREAIEACCERPSRRPFVAARGDPPVPGKDGEIKFLVPLERVVDLPADLLQVDFRDVTKFPDVKQGQTIAVKTPPVPGSPGKSVTGIHLPAHPPRDPRFRAGKGVEIQERDGGLLMAVATVSGYPMFAEDSGTVSVDPVFTHRGDVDMSSGNIRTSGSVSILGQVTEGMRVESEGNQEISGAVTEATVKAWGSIRISGNVFKSTVTAGKDSTWIRSMDTLLRSVEERAESILSIEQIHGEALERKDRGEPALGDDAILDESAQVERFRNLALAVSALLKENIKAFPADIAEQVRQTRQMLSAFGASIFERARGISDLLIDARDYIDAELLQGKSDVILPYAQSSTIEASRDITITGQGAFYCQLLAGRAVKTSGSPGLVRSGEARARELIQVNAAGGQGAAPTVLVVSPGGQILANTIYPNTVLTIGHLSFRTEDTLRAVKASLVENRLVVATANGPIEVD
ncbi:MAG: DUF342 domain-containing protein [Bacillota bacterium]|jgi:hypothetical protein